MPATASPMGRPSPDRLLQPRPPRRGLSPGGLALAAAGAAVVLWGCLPALRLMIGDQPPFLTTAIALFSAAAMETLRGWGAALRRPEGTAAPLSPGRGAGLALGLVGAIGFYFIGLDRAPAAQVTLVTYTWPLVFVMASELLETGRLRAAVLGGGAAAFAGAALAILGDGGDGGGGGDGGAVGGDGFGAAARLTGCAAGALAGLCWAAYSLMLSRGAPLGAEAWPRIFTLAAVAAGACHLALEPAPQALDPRAVGLAAAIGLGPYGLAFVAWGYGLARGPARAAGALAYGVPVIATGLLTALGAADPGWELGLAAALVVAGAALAGRPQGGAPTPPRPRRSAP